jgi:3-hydroxypropanoate dehydrogenase
MSGYTLPAPTADEIVDIKMATALDEPSLAKIFVEARTANAFLKRPVPHQLLERALDLALLGPTSANSLPLRIVFIESPEAKQRLKPALWEGNRDKTIAAPVTAIIAADLKFFEHFPRLFPQRGEMLKDTFGGMPPPAQRASAWDNALLQMAYFIIALRAVGLDAGPMAGFERTVVDQAFFPDGQFVSQYLINIGYADESNTFPRLPRFRADDIARFA